MKLSGWRWRGQQPLRLYPRAELGPIVDTVLALLEKTEEEESVLVEAMCPPAHLPCPGETLVLALEGGKGGEGNFLELDSGAHCLSQAASRQALSWLCASVLWCAGHKGIGLC